MTLVTAMNKVLIESTTVDKFATSWFGLYLHDSKKLISLNAGHNPPYLFRSGMETPIELGTGGIFLGGYELPYKTEEIELRKNDVLIFYSDGVTEAFNEKEEEYGEQRLIKVAFDHAGQSEQHILSEIEKDVKKHVGKAQQSDDFTCVVVKIL
jgi:sigma-B regulation protein RsbU (phosphoserine phosphatase)